MKRLLYTAIATITAFTMGCAGGKGFRSVGVDQFAETAKEPETQLVDVRTAEEHTAGHIPGSINIDVKSDNFIDEASRTLDKKRPVAVYCRSGRRSKNAAEQLAGKGFKVIELDSGYSGWVKAGKHIE